ncbi:lipopolysaccharide kinase InaA family protein [Humisphaera borealis]|uniref:Protein kinase domain-containing protein n=1 Tax=Humisphaera borealis TaxID=2807512 RepID=A0A7M2WXA5_9BACT|nr:lipopolysaccharide kinase InaA family protein [Humisphaera borealis]QOV90039.1 hypothetical protein IPV69_01300 [Humisphaera borealis]
MSPQQLEQTLRDLPRVGTLIKDRGYRQIWRFEFDGKAYYLKFYPRGRSFFSRDGWRRRFRGSPAYNEFQRLQWLQKAKIPAPRAVAILGGFVLDGIKGDAVILHAIEPSVSLDELLNDQAVHGEYSSRQRRDLADQVIDLVYKLGQAGYGHHDLHLGNFLLHDGRLHLIDAYALRKGGLTTADVLMLGAGVARFATTTDLLRGWRKLVGEGPIPRSNPNASAIWQSQLSRIKGGNRYFGRLSLDGWRGVFFKQTKHPRRWAEVSHLEVSKMDWQSTLPAIVRALEDGSLKTLKSSPSGDVYEGALKLGEYNVDVVIKQPHKRYWYRYFNEIGRGSRSRRAWYKAWNLIVRDLPTAWPLAYFERTRLGYVTQSFIVFEKVPGPTFWTVDLDALTDRSREMLFHRAGRLLRLLERFGMSHFDAKASNWIVRADEATGPSPVLIDVDGIRFRRWTALGIDRLLRSLLGRKQYSPDDSLALCRGYAPYTRLEAPRTDAEVEDPARTSDTPGDG